MNGDDMLKSVTDELDKLLSPAHVMGNAIDLADKAVIPVVEYGFGFGAAQGKGEGKSGEGGEGAGSGGGGGITPVALVIVHKDLKGAEGIQVISLRKGSPIAQVISTVAESLAPQVISAIKEMSGKKEEKSSEKTE
ncbi:MAG TPA: spore germination protein GerW family protein [Methanoregulaceae archaeon]|nr:spore germination protein GerW family protein [Methanoregulaceae archaeon]